MLTLLVHIFLIINLGVASQVITTQPFGTVVDSSDDTINQVPRLSLPDRRPTEIDMTQFSNDILRDRNEAITKLFHDSVGSHKTWLQAAHVIYCLEKLMQAGATISAGCSGFIKGNSAVITSAVMGTSSLALAGLALYATKESAKRLARANSILNDLHLPPIPANAINADQNSTPRHSSFR